MPDSQSDPLRHRHRVKMARRRLTVVIGLCILMAGYAMLAISPDTASEWVLIRVVLGFGFLFVGFAIAIVPMLSRLTGGDD